MGLETTRLNLYVWLRPTIWETKISSQKTSFLFVLGLMIASLQMTVLTYWQVKIKYKSLLKWALYFCSGNHFGLVLFWFQMYKENALKDSSAQYCKQIV